MTKPYFATAIFLLSSACMLAQVSNSQAQPSSAAQQSDQASRGQVHSKKTQTIKACLSGSANTFVLTDATGI